MTDPTPGPGDSGSFPWPPSSGRQQRTHVWGSEIPFRNEYFIGREAELSALREQLVGGGPAVIRQPPRALYGLGGVGKTQIATEYAHRFADDYEVVWWVRSDQEDTILASLVSLGTQLRIPEVSPGDRDRSLRLVLNALQSGDPYARWLLIFDDVTQPQKLRRYIPQGGHVVITSRITEWRNVLSTDGIEVKEFARADTVQFLRTRVPQLAVTGDASSDAEAARHAGRLAEALGDLPLAAEHAAAFLSQTGGPVSDYIDAFKADAHTLLAQDADMLTTSVAVSTTWTVARTWLSPEARELFQLLAFFAAEPIAEENLLHAERTTLDPALPGPLQKVLTSRAEMKRAQRELARYSFISVYGARNVAQLHRVVQAVTESRIRRENPELAALLKKTVFSLLAATDPDAPEREANDVIYARTIYHLVPTGALESDDRRLRNLIINQVRRLRMRGGNREALSLGEPALKIWQADPDDIQTLAMAIEVAVAKRELGSWEEAFALNTDTLRRLREHYGEDDDTYLICANSYGADLLLRGRYDDALAHDLGLLPAFDRVFGENQFRPLNLRNNIAVDLRCVGRFAEALEYDRQVAAERERQFGASNWQLSSSLFGMARDLRWLSRYDEALEVSRTLADLMDARGEPWNFNRLEMFSGVAVSLRWAGYYPEARDLAEDVYRRYVDFAGEDDRYTLMAATNLICDRRIVGDLVQAEDLGRATVAAWKRIVGPGHPNTLSAQANLATVLRGRQFPSAAREMNQAALDGFRRLFPAYDHPSTLIVMTNLASDLAAVGEVREARAIGEEAIAMSQGSRGEGNPFILVTAANLSLDLRATGDPDAAVELLAKTLAAFDETQGAEHPRTVQARHGGRLNLDIEPTYR